MIMAADNAEAVFVAYGAFECVMETADTFLFVYGDHATVLKKEDFRTDNMEEFRSFLSEKIKNYQTIATI